MNANIVIAVGTAVIALYTICNYKLYKAIQKKNEESRIQTSDLYQAIVIATLLSGPSSYGQMPAAIEEFKKHYKGKTKIFNV